MSDFHSYANMQTIITLFTILFFCFTNYYVMSLGRTCVHGREWSETWIRLDRL